MKFLSIVFFAAVVSANFEVDIDKLGNTSYKIWIDDKYYTCKPKTPPLSHSWSYECVNPPRNLRAGKDNSLDLLQDLV